MPTSTKSTGSQTSWMSQPGIQQILGTAANIFNSGAAWKPNTTSQVTPFSTQTRAGLTGMNNTAKAVQPQFNQNYSRVTNALAGLGSNGLTDLQDNSVAALQGIANGNGLNSMQQQAYNQYSPYANGNGLNSMQQSQYDALNKIGQGSGYNTEQQNAVNYLNGIANGSQLQNNPYLEDVIKRTSGDIAGADNLMASGAGRYGSDSHAGVLGEDIGNATSQLRFNDYNNQLGRQDAAIQNLFGFGTQGMGQKMGAISGAANLGTTGANQQLNAIGNQAGLGTTGFNQRNDAIGSLYNAGQQGLENIQGGTSALNDAYNARLSPYQTMMGVGNAYENKNTQVLQDQARQFQERKNSLTDPVNWLANLASAYNGGQQVSNGTTPYNPFQQGIGGGIAAYGATGNPYLGLLGGAAGFF